MTTKKRNRDYDDVCAVCDECAREAGFVPKKEKVVGVWPAHCDICGRMRTCTDLHHDWKRATVPTKSKKTKFEINITMRRGGETFQLVENDGEGCVDCAFHAKECPYSLYRVYLTTKKARIYPCMISGKHRVWKQVTQKWK